MEKVSITFNKFDRKYSVVLICVSLGQPKFTTGKWNPPVNAQFATANDVSVKGWDIRNSVKPVWIIENAHLQLVRYLKFLTDCTMNGRTA